MHDQTRPGSPGDRLMTLTETAVYAAVALLLVACAGLALYDVAVGLVGDAPDGALAAVEKALDGLLLVFIVVELFGAVRQTMAERKLVAEPFLVVGIIASIKEIVVATLEATHAKGDAFDRGMMQVGVLGVVVLLLAVATYLMRRKEREPEEG